MYTGICLRSVFPSMTTLSTGYLVIAQNDYIYVARSKKEMLDGTYDMNTHTVTDTNTLTYSSRSKCTYKYVVYIYMQSIPWKWIFKKKNSRESDVSIDVKQNAAKYARFGWAQRPISHPHFLLKSKLVWRIYAPQNS